MIKFSGQTDDGKTMVGFGLSEGNIKKLLAGQPILVDLEKDMQLSFKVKILIFAGETEAAMVSELQHLITNETKIKTD